MPDVYLSTLLHCESLQESAADKFVVSALRATIKVRNVWDLTWLYQQKVEVDAQLVMEEFTDYRADNVRQKLESRLMAKQEYTKKALIIL